MYPSADSLVNGAFVGLQKRFCAFASSKSVPPTAILNGVDASPFTAIPPLAGAGMLKSSQFADPESPEATVTVIPCAAACSHNALKNALPVPKCASQTLKLRLITSSELLSTTYSAPRVTPSD